MFTKRLKDNFIPLISIVLCLILLVIQIYPLTQMLVSNLKKLQTAKTYYSTIISYQKKLQDQANTLDAQNSLTTINSKVTFNESASDYLRLINNLGSKYSVVISNASVSEISKLSKLNKFRVLPINVTLKGSYTNLINYVKEFTTADTLTLISSYKLSEISTNKWQLEIEFQKYQFDTVDLSKNINDSTYRIDLSGDKIQKVLKTIQN